MPLPLLVFTEGLMVIARTGPPVSVGEPLQWTRIGLPSAAGPCPARRGVRGREFVLALADAQ